MPHSDFFWVRVENTDEASHLRLTGRFDSAALPHLDALITDAQDRDVVLDLDGLSFMDGSAWLAVMSYEQRVREWGGDFRLVNAIGAIRKIFESTETENLLSGSGGR